MFAELQNRKLSAIMFSDIFGYSKMMSQNEQIALSIVDDYRELAELIVTKYKGRIIKWMGDGFFSEFTSALKAAQCAVDLQKAVKRYNSKSNQLFEVKIRIGLHLGDVIEKGDDLYGDGINVAARIEPLAKPGGICISESIYSVINSHPEFDVTPIGKTKLKNIKHHYHLYNIVTGFELNKFRTKSKIYSQSLKNKSNKFVFYLMGSIIIFTSIFFLIKNTLFLNNPNNNPNTNDIVSSSNNIAVDLLKTDKNQQFITDINDIKDFQMLSKYLESKRNKGEITFGNKEDFYDKNRKFVIVLDDIYIHKLLFYYDSLFFETTLKKYYSDLSQFAGKRTIWIEIL